MCSILIRSSTCLLDQEEEEKEEKGLQKQEQDRQVSFKEPIGTFKVIEMRQKWKLRPGMGQVSYALWVPSGTFMPAKH